MAGFSDSELHAASVSEAPRGRVLLDVSSLDCGVAGSGRPAGDAAFSGERSLSGRARRERDAEIVRLSGEGFTDTEIARLHGVTRSRVTQIRIASGVTRNIKRKFRSARQDRFLVLYEAGFAIAEIANREKSSRSCVQASLKECPFFVPRKGAPHKGRSVIVPAWVPTEHAGRYRRIAAANGEEIAASCLRKLKRLEARS